MSTTEPREPRESTTSQQREQQQQRPATQAYTTGSSASRADPAAASSSPPSAASTAGPVTTTPRPRRERSSASGSGTALAIAALVLGLVLGAFGMQLVDNSGDDSGGNVLAGSIDENGYQAVILTNDKVYFGRLSEVNDTFFRLDDAFFLRETRENPEAEPVRALLPVNRELHVPENRMLIRQDEVVLVENLDKDSPLIDEIERQTGGNGN